MTFERVLKFGGAALADGPSVRRACRIVAEGAAAGPPVVVVSAHRGVTDLLETVALAAAAGRIEAAGVRIRHRSLFAQLGLPSELLDRFWRELLQLLAQVRERGSLGAAELDLALSFGERSSARVVARVLDGLGVPATPVDAWDLGFLTDSNHGRARPLEGIDAAIRAALEEVPGVPVVTGFLAKDRRGNLTTLGRNGSDVTASVIAEAIGARELEFWKAVGGILTADPALVPDARTLASVTYDEAAELAFHGARVLHPAAIAPAVRARAAVRVRDVHAPDDPGTAFTPAAVRAGPVSVASRAAVLRLELCVDAPERRGERAARLFDVLDACGVGHGLLSASGERICAFVEPGPGIPAALAELGPGARVVGDLATVALVGHGLGASRDLARRALDRLQDAGVTVQHAFLGARAASQAFVVAAADLERAVRALHDGVLVVPQHAGG